MNENLNFERSPTGQFLLGHTNVGGRPKGSRPKLAALFWDDLYDVWKTKGKKVLERMIIEDPVSFAKIAALLVSKCEDSRVDDSRQAELLQVIEERRQAAALRIAQMRSSE
jgi:hypothetical protein